MSGNNRTPASEAMEEGLRLKKAGLFQKALERYSEARQQTADTAQVAESWRLEAFAHHAMGAWDQALEAAEESERLARGLHRSDLICEALNARAAVLYSRGHLEEAKALYAEMLELAPPPRVKGLALQNLAIVHGRQGDLEEADRRLEEAYGRFEEAGYTWGQAHVLNNRSGMALERKEHAKAAELAKHAIVVARRVDDLDLLAIATLNAAEGLAGLGRWDEAETEASTALGHFQTSGNRWRRVACLRLLGDLQERQDSLEIARRFWRSGLDLAEEIGAEEEAGELRKRLESSGPES